ncbi:MAG: sulfatase-like hydrolase/transferase [Planctomycetaceae bacterium]|nr:sulfatase-like hydrolase/transferase [Planctomycetaceae bacterium]
MSGGVCHWNSVQERMMIWQRLSSMLVLSGCVLVLFGQGGLAADRPNILWITSEDNGPHLGCYGDDYAVTPNLDRFSDTGTRYLNCWSNAPVCAPARTCIISGLYPPSTGSQHMRSETRLPDGFRMFPQYLRDAGYYCTNNSKEDYNLVHPGQVWDESSTKAHWKNRRSGQPFFAVFNLTVSHESQIRNDIERKNRIHDPAKARIPAYHPDLPEVRRDWAQYYDRLTMMDAEFGERLKEMEVAGLANDTIVFYFGDHGSGMPRNKRWLYDSGLKVPLLIRIPEKFAALRSPDYQTGGTSDRLVAFVDLAPTMLSLVGIQPPDYLQGHAFLGPFNAEPQSYLYGFRDRMDERIDMSRSVCDQQYLYIRNYHPHKPYGQYLVYMFETPTTRVWKRQFDLGALNEDQSHFWRTKPPEELYDRAADRDQVKNLVSSSNPAHQAALARLRQENTNHLLRIRDLGFLPEGEIHSRSLDSSPYEMGHDPMQYPLEEIMRMAELASSLDPAAVPELAAALTADDSAVRYWAALGLLMRGKEALKVEDAHEGLIDAIEDDSEFVRVVACEALGRYSDDRDDQVQTLTVLVDRANFNQYGLFVAMSALNALDELDGKARPELRRIKELPEVPTSAPKRMQNYVQRLKEKIVADLER